MHRIRVNYPEGAVFMKVYVEVEDDAVRIAERVHPDAISVEFIPKGYNSLN